MGFEGMIVGLAIVLVLKFVFKNLIINNFANMLSGGEGGNKIISAVIHFIAPGLLSLIFLVAAYFVGQTCPQLGTFLVVVAVIIGGIMGLGFVYFISFIPYIGAVLAPIASPIVAVFWILLIVSIIEFILSIVLPIVLPGVGLVLDIVLTLVISIVMVLIMWGFVGDVFNIMTCVPTAKGIGFLNEPIKKIFGIWIGAPKPF